MSTMLGVIRPLYDLVDAAGVTGTTTGTITYVPGPQCVIQAKVVGTGAVAATVTVYVSADGRTFLTTPAGTISLSGTTSSIDGFAISAPWPYIRADVSGVSGTGATVNAYMAVAP